MNIVREATKAFKREYQQAGYANEQEARFDKRLQRLARELGEAKNARERREAQERYEAAKREDEGEGRGRERAVKPYEDEARRGREKFQPLGKHNPDDLVGDDADEDDQDEED